MQYYLAINSLCKHCRHSEIFTSWPTTTAIQVKYSLLKCIMMHDNDGWFLFCFIETEGSQTSTLGPWGKFLNSNLFTDTVFFSLVSPLYWLGNKVKNWNKRIFVSKFLQKDKWSCQDGTEVETLGRSLEMLSNTASVCRWWVYTSSDLVFDKGTHEALSWCCHCLFCWKRKSLLCLRRKLNKQQKPEAVDQTEAEGARWWRWVAQIYMSQPTLQTTATSHLESPCFTGRAVKCLPELSITETWAVVRRGETADSGDSYLSARPQRITRSFGLYVWFGPRRHMMHIWYGWTRGETHSLCLLVLWNITWKIFLENYKITQNIIHKNRCYSNISF